MSPTGNGPRSRRGMLGTIACALIGAAALCGCESGRTSRAASLYDRGDYPAALREAETAHAGANGVRRDRAALIAGMSAHRLKRYSEAERWLRQAAGSTDAEVAGRASATLGLVNVERDNFSAAALDFSAAGRRLKGNEAARAHYFAGEASMLQGRPDAARRSYTEARSLTTDPVLRTRIESRLAAPRAYTLQIGAFADRANAQKAMSSVGAKARSAGLPAPTLSVNSQIGTRPLYVVQLGRFNTREEAMTAKASLGGDGNPVPATR